MRYKNKYTLCKHEITFGEGELAEERIIKDFCDKCKERRKEYEIGKQVAIEKGYPILLGSERQQIAGEGIRHIWIKGFDFIKNNKKFTDVEKEEYSRKLDILLKAEIFSEYYIKKCNYKENGIVKAAKEYKEKFKYQTLIPVLKKYSCLVYFKDLKEKFRLYFEGGKSQEALDIFHNLEFKWHNRSFYWYKDYSDEEEAEKNFIELIKILQGIGYEVNIYFEDYEKYKEKI